MRIDDNAKTDSPVIIAMMARARREGYTTRDDERRLGKIINRGRRHTSARNSAAYRDATQELVERNAPWIMKESGVFRNRGLEMDDIVQHGMLGAYVAASRFDYTLGFRFITYSQAWIRQEIRRAIHYTSRTIRIPVCKSQEIHTEIRRLEAEGMSASNIDTSGNRALKDALMACRTVSIEQSICDLDRSEGGCLTIGHTAAFAAHDPEFDRVELDSERASIDAAMQKALDARERTIVRRYYGFDGGGDGDTLESIGETLGVTRERVRQIRVQALEKLAVELTGSSRRSALLRLARGAA